MCTLFLVGSAGMGFVQVDSVAADFTLISREVERNNLISLSLPSRLYRLQLHVATLFFSCLGH